MRPSPSSDATNAWRQVSRTRRARRGRIARERGDSCTTSTTTTGSQGSGPRTPSAVARERGVGDRRRTRLIIFRHPGRSRLSADPESYGTRTGVGFKNRNPTASRLGDVVPDESIKRDIPSVCAWRTERGCCEYASRSARPSQWPLWSGAHLEEAVDDARSVPRQHSANEGRVLGEERLFAAVGRPTPTTSGWRGGPAFR